MKVFEILRNDATTPVTEESVATRLKNFDWGYEFSDSVIKQARGAREMELIENLVYQLWKVNPSRAIQLWADHAPGYSESIEPSFIFRLQSQEGQ